MNNEIKEILDKLKDNDWYEELDLTGTKWIELKQEETNQLLDYITNLQEDLKGYKEELENLSRRCDTLEFQNAELERCFEPKAKEDYDLY